MYTKDMCLEEYKATNEAIYHNERLMWQIGSILNAVVAVMIGQMISKGVFDNLWLVMIISYIFSVFWYLFATHYRMINREKFKRIHELEEILNFRQNLLVKELHEKMVNRIRLHHLIIGISFVLPVFLSICWILYKIDLI